MWHLTPDMWHMTHDTWQMTLDTWCTGSGEHYHKISDNELTGDKGVCRTAPVTPGLLIIVRDMFSQNPFKTNLLKISHPILIPKKLFLLIIIQICLNFNLCTIIQLVIFKSHSTTWNCEQMIKQISKIPHTGDKESLDRCG